MTSKPRGKTALRLYYGDEKLSPPDYDYAPLFHRDTSAAPAQFGPGAHKRNPAVVPTIGLV